MPDSISMFSLSALERLWLSIETSGPRYAVAERSESRGKPFLGRDHEFPAEVSSFSDETGCRDVIRYAEPSRRVSREGFDASGHAGRLLFRLRSEDQNHPFPLQTRHLLHFGPLFQIGREAQQQDFALILEDDLAAAEEDVRFHFGALFQEIFRMLELEVVVVIVRVRPETDFLDYHLDDLRLDLLSFLFLLVQEFRVVDDPAYGGIGLGRNFDRCGRRRSGRQ